MQSLLVLAFPFNVAVFVTAHSSIPLTPVTSAHTCTDPAVSFTVSISVTILIAAFIAVTENHAAVDKLEGVNLTTKI